MSRNKKKSKIKISVSSLPKAQSQDPAWAQRTWAVLRSAIDDIFSESVSTLSFEELYRNSYNMVLYKFGGLLYNNVRDTIKTHLMELRGPVSGAHDDVLLPSLLEAWRKHRSSLGCIRDILLYMDRSWVPNEPGTLPVYDMGLQSFLQMVVKPQKARVTRSLLGMVFRERNGEPIDRQLFKSLSSMLSELGVYEEYFETPFLEASSHFYEVESSMYIANNTVSEYTDKVEARLVEERSRVQLYLDSQTGPKIRETLERELINAHKEQMVRDGLSQFMERFQLPELSLLYSLLSRVHRGLDLLRESTINYIETEGRLLVTTEPEGPRSKATFNDFVQNLLNMRSKYNSILENAFQGDRNFQKAINLAFERFVNLNQRTPQYLSLYVDDQLKNGLKGASDEATEAVLEGVISLFRYLTDKDIFERYFKNHLSKRLLDQNSGNEEGERLMVAKLKMECGFAFTTKLEGMFQDMQQNVELDERVQEWLSDRKPPCAMSFRVLTTTYWPSVNVRGADEPVQLPRVMQQAFDLFKSYYMDRHEGRKLTLQPELGSVDVRVQVRKIRRTVVCSTLQAVLLLLWNENSTMTYKEIMERTSISSHNMERHLLALAASKKKDMRILKKTGNVKTLGSDDEFSLNPKWKPRLKRVKMGLLGASKQRQKDAVDTERKVAEERKINIDACVVRVMKSRQELSHKMLITEVSRALMARFKPQPKMIKRQIESLISREYLERCEIDGTPSYRYIS